jgi:DNA-binding transcriptional regulator YdaS (Cro superfamily)
MAMDLLHYLSPMSAADRASFAKKCGTSLAYLRQVAYGNKNCGAELAINIDRESGGEVLLEQLCPAPDWEYVQAKKPIRRTGSTA